MAYTSIVFNSVTLNATSVSPRQVQSTLKYKVGKTLVRVNTPTRDLFDWEINISGIIDSDIDTVRTALTASNDVEVHAYTDGLHNGNYILLPESLTFSDVESDAGMVYRFSMTLIEFNQT